MGYQTVMQDDDLRGSTERTQRRILVETTIANNKKSMGIAYLLLFLFGGLGIHNFYIGKYGLGAGQMLGIMLGWAANFNGVARHRAADLHYRRHQPAARSLLHSRAHQRPYREDAREHERQHGLG